MLFSHGVKPALVENGADRQIYGIATNKSEFCLFVKYRDMKINTKKTDYSSWVFTIKDDKDELKSYLDNNINVNLAWVCGEENLGKSQLAVLDSSQIRQILDSNKTTITITINKERTHF